MRKCEPDRRDHVLMRLRTRGGAPADQGAAAADPVGAGTSRAASPAPQRDEQPAAGRSRASQPADAAEMLRRVAKAVELGRPVGLSDLESVLHALARTSGSPQVLRAARTVAKPLGGRPAVDDTEALAELDWLRRTGNAKSLRQAAWLVARRVASGEPASRVADRLRRKLREKEKRGKSIFLPQRDRR
jgi:hypothetical protein